MITIKTTGLGQLTRVLREIDTRLRRSMTPLLEKLETAMVRAFKANVESGGSRLAGIVMWPDPHPATLAIRRFYGHDGKPRLKRGGQLAASIGPFGRTDRAVDVGSFEPFSHVLHEGGEVRDARGNVRRVQAHPFLIATASDREEWNELIANYFVDEVFDGAS